MATEQTLKAKELTHESTKHLLVSLKCIPDDKLDWVPMGKAKTPLAIAVECGAGYKWLAAELRGDENAGAVWEGMDPGQYATRDAVIALIDESQNELDEAMEALAEEQLEDKRKMFWGEELTLGHLMWMGKMHTDYHTGQLNYIQLLLGDEEMHME